MGEPQKDAATAPVVIAAYTTPETYCCLLCVWLYYVQLSFLQDPLMKLGQKNRLPKLHQVVRSDIEINSSRAGDWGPTALCIALIVSR